jgi:GDP-D-mannose dehydratase
MKGHVTIPSIARQDGSYPAEFLFSQGYEVYGIVRCGTLADATRHLSRLDAIRNRTFLQGVAKEAAVHVSG